MSCYTKWRMGCQPCYYIYEILKLTTEWQLYLNAVTQISLLLMPRFIILLQSHGRHSNSVVCVVGMNILAFAASLLASTTPIIYYVVSAILCFLYTTICGHFSLCCTIIISCKVYSQDEPKADLLALFLTFSKCLWFYMYTTFTILLINIFLGSVAIDNGLWLFLVLSFLYYFYGDFLSPPVPIILLSKLQQLCCVLSGWLALDHS